MTVKYEEFFQVEFPLKRLVLPSNKPNKASKIPMILSNNKLIQFAGFSCCSFEEFMRFSHHTDAIQTCDRIFISLFLSLKFFWRANSILFTFNSCVLHLFCVLFKAQKI